MRREDRSSISSHPLADLGRNGNCGATSSLCPFGTVPLFVPEGAVPSPRPAVAVGRRAQELSRLAARGGHPQGSVLTAPSMVPRLCRLGRCSARPHAFEYALLVENRPCNAGKLVGKRDRQHIVVQSLFGGVNPRFEPIAVPVLDPDQHDPSRLGVVGQGKELGTLRP